MLVIKSFHIIAVVAWFAGLFYLPRLFVYHAEAQDQISIERFKVMERRLYYGIMWPAALLATVLGLGLVSYNWPYYLKAGWMHLKLTAVLALWAYHLLCGRYLSCFAQGKSEKTPFFFRVFNEIPTVFLIVIVLLVVIKPF
jgi:putative membrane protein